MISTRGKVWLYTVSIVDVETGENKEYIGEIKQLLEKRFNEHKMDVKKDHLNTVLDRIV